jgi:glycerol-3-phosphate dehydrogenase
VTGKTETDAPRFDRATALDALRGGSFDVLVIGGGVTGAGVLLDAASRGLKAALVEQDDFASGTSSKSSKMVHGGLRYLQQREFRLVYENLAERQRLLENAPHLVSPLPFLIPLFGKDGVVSKAMSRSYATALWLYDVTGGLRIGERHRRVTKEEALAHLPTLHTERLVAGFLYYDARADDARLTLSLVRTAVLNHGAVAVNHARAERFLTDGSGAVEGVHLRTAEGEELDVRAKTVVNATGVWADQLRSLGTAQPTHSIRPAKGVHVTVPASRLPADIAAVIPVRSDRRSIFVVPWPEGGLVYIGTTDTDYTGDLEHPECTPEDVAYLLDAVNTVTSSALTPADVTGVWAGLRPLLRPSSEGKHPSERTADLSRRHTVATDPDGLVTVTGGKLTTYRKMAEDTVDAVVARLGRGIDATRCRTKRLRLRGAAVPASAPAPTALSITPGTLDAHLAARYGTEAPEVLALAAERAELLDPVVPGLPYLRAEVVYAARHEMAASVDDVLARRTRAVLQDARGAAAASLDVAGLLGAELGWDEARIALEAAAFSQRALADLATAGIPAPDDQDVPNHSEVSR